MTIFDLENATEARFGEDNPNHGMGPVPNIGSTNTAELALLKSLRDAVTTVRDAGVTVSADVDRVFGVMEALNSHQGAVATPSIAGVSPDEAVKVLEEFAVAKTRQAKTVAGGTVYDEAKAALRSAAIHELAQALRDSVDDTLTQLHDRYAEAAKAYAEGHDLVLAHPTVATVADGDFNGERVALWHRTRTAALDLDLVANTVMTLAMEKPRFSVNYDRRIALMADLGGASVFSLAGADDRLRTGEPKSQTPFGLAPLLVEAGASLSLPASGDAWAQRVEDYQDARDAAATEAYR